MSSVSEDTLETNPTPAHAGFSSRDKKPGFDPRRQQAEAPKAGSPEADIFTDDDLQRNRGTGHTFGEDFTLPEEDAYGRREPFVSPEPVASAAAEDRTVSEETVSEENAFPETATPETVSQALTNDLLSTIAQVWQQETVDPAAFERIRHFKAEPGPHVGMVTLVNEEDDDIYIGVHPESGEHSVVGRSEISPRQALDRVYVALTDDLMRAEGVDEVVGPDLDKALLCLAAEKNGLKINNMPELSDEVKAEALKLWQEAFPDEAPAPAPVAAPVSSPVPAPEAETAAEAGAHASAQPDVPAADVPAADETAANDAPAEEKVIKVDGTDVLPAEGKVVPTAAPAEPDIIDATFKEKPDDESVAVLENAAPETETTTETTTEATTMTETTTETTTPDPAASAAPPSVIPMGYTPPEEPAAATPPAVIPLGYIPDEFVEAVETSAARVSNVKPAALYILRGETAEDSVDPQIFENFVADLKGGKFSDAQGMLAEDNIRATFNRKVGDSTEGDVLLKAAVAQGVVYDTTKAVAARRMVANPHVSCPGRYEKPKPTF